MPATVNVPSAPSEMVPSHTITRLPLIVDVRQEDSVMAAVNDLVTPYKRLRDVVFVDALPVSAAGKVLKRELAARERTAS